MRNRTLTSPVPLCRCRFVYRPFLKRTPPTDAPCAVHRDIKGGPATFLALGRIPIVLTDLP